MKKKDLKLERSFLIAERMTGIEPAPSVWKTEALPLSYIRGVLTFSLRNRRNKNILWGRLT